MNRAYSLIEIKGLDSDKRTFRGWATTPALDRVADTINPKGATFKNPLALLHQHRHDAPIGTVTFSKPTERGIEFEATIPTIHEPGPLKDRVDTAWGELQHGLVRAVSIGFRPTKDPRPNEKGGLVFDGVEIFELSTVTIPANAEAIITAVKSFDQPALEAAGIEDDPLPQVPGLDARTFMDQPEIPADDTPAAPGKKARVVKLDAPARAGAKPFTLAANWNSSKRV